VGSQEMSAKEKQEQLMPGWHQLRHHHSWVIHPASQNQLLSLKHLEACKTKLQNMSPLQNLRHNPCNPLHQEIWILLSFIWPFPLMNIGSSNHRKNNNTEYDGTSKHKDQLQNVKKQTDLLNLDADWVLTSG